MLFIFCYEIIVNKKTSWSNSPLTFAINNYFSPLLFHAPLTPTMMITIVKKLQFWKKLLNSLMESMWKNMGTNLGLEWVIDDTMVVDSTIMTTCMSSFSNPLLEFDSMLKFSTFTNMPFCKYYSCISIWGDLTLKMIVVRISLSNKS